MRIPYGLCLLLLPLLSGCASDPGPTTQIHVDYGTARAAVDATLPFDAAARPAASRYLAEGATHPGFYNAFDQLVHWAATGHTYSVKHDATFGFFLESIDGVQAPQSFWELSLNGKKSEVGMDQVQVRAGDAVSWRLVAF